ncbi:MAG: helix-turn-helix domain-containing protein [Bacillus sp. (in: Bacteria)]|nr:helix-turn-helix domain-containing protein [Bacillus sp. (in: firmicutes)]
MIYISIGRNAKRIRLEKGLKQSYVATKLGFKASSSYSDIESGRRNLSVEKLPILASTLDVDIKDLFYEGKNSQSER